MNREFLIETVQNLHKTWDWSLAEEIDFSVADAHRDFYLQFTTLYWSKDHWKLGTILEYVGTELIYSMNVDYAEGMHIEFESWKNNWPKHNIFETRDLDPKEIPLWTLFPDFQPHNYKGHVWMR